MAFVAAGSAKEYGIRRALGAERAELLTLVLRRGLALAGAGILIGVATAVPAARLVEGLLFEVAPLDLPVFGLAGLTLAAAGAAAVLVPALRAARASPVEVLRVE
ncbi:MAG: FtsX-like permease family protein [Acidobacteriota bacterium]|nr:FtsX-like permease family protein [Acidobacteriota bacterium]